MSVGHQWVVKWFGLTGLTVCLAGCADTLLEADAMVDEPSWATTQAVKQEGEIASASSDRSQGADANTPPGDLDVLKPQGDQQSWARTSTSASPPSANGTEPVLARTGQKITRQMRTDTSNQPDDGNTAVRKAVDKLTAISKPGAAAYQIGPRDVLAISVHQVPDLTRSVEVNDSGTFRYPLLSEVRAVGLTTRQIEQNLIRDLGDRYLHNPQVAVSVEKFNSQRVTIEGSIGKPGVYPIDGRLTLLQLVATAGGLTKIATTTVVVFRDEKKGRTAAKFDISEIRNGTVKDPILRAGDVVIASDSAYKTTVENVMKVLPLASFFLAF